MDERIAQQIIHFLQQNNNQRLICLVFCCCCWTEKKRNLKFVFAPFQKWLSCFFEICSLQKNICLSSQLPLRANYLLEREDGKAINYQLFSHVHSKSDCPCKRLFLRTCLFPFLVVNCFGWSCESFVVKYAKVFAGWSMFSGNNIVRVIY